MIVRSRSICHPGDGLSELEDQPDARGVHQQLGLLHGVAVDDHQVGELAGLDGAHLIVEPERVSATDRRGGKCLERAEPVADHAHELECVVPSGDQS